MYVSFEIAALFSKHFKTNIHLVYVESFLYYLSSSQLLLSNNTIMGKTALYLVTSELYNFKNKL